MSNLICENFGEAHNDTFACWPEHWGRLRKSARRITGQELFRAYKENQLFFWIHWQVDLPKGSKTIAAGLDLPILLHVESLRYKDKPGLNDIKRDVIKSLLESGVAELVENQGWQCRFGPRISLAQIQANKTTQAFTIEIPPALRATTAKEDIEVVHAKLGHLVDEALQKCASRLNGYFGI